MEHRVCVLRGGKMRNISKSTFLSGQSLKHVIRSCSANKTQNVLMEERQNLGHFNF